MTFSEGFRSRFDLTLIITADPSTEVRGFSILGREFRLNRVHTPVEDECVTLDGVRFKDRGYLIDQQEWFRVVPEASRSDYRERYVFIPEWAAKVSFRPKSMT